MVGYLIELSRHYCMNHDITLFWGDALCMKLELDISDVGESITESNILWKLWEQASYEQE